MAQSYITMPSNEVAKLAQSCIDRIDASRERRRKRLIDSELACVNRTQPSWWDRLLGRQPPKPMTEAEVREKLEAETSFHSDYYRINALYGAQRNTAEALLNASKYSSSINITAYDLDRIT